MDVSTAHPNFPRMLVECTTLSKPIAPHSDVADFSGDLGVSPLRMVKPNGPVLPAQVRVADKQSDRFVGPF